MSKIDDEIKGQLAVMNELVSRAMLASKMGQSFGGDRNIYESCGYPENITFEEYLGKYKRHPLGKTIVSAYPNKTWAVPPTVYETEDDDETEFEREWKRIEDEVHIWHHLHRIDRMSGVGQYGVLYLGFEGDEDLLQPPNPGSRLMYVKPYYQSKAPIEKTISDINDPDYGKPEIYKLKVKLDNSEREHQVHYSRILHVAEGLDDSDIYGTPRMEACYNNLIDIEKILGGSAEMFWQGAFMGIAFEADAGAKMNDSQKEAMKEEIQNWIHRLQRFIRLQGVKANQMEPTIADPMNHLKVQIQSVSALTRIPFRILIGSEEAKLASSEDRNNFLDSVEQRDITYAEPMIIRSLIDKLIKYESIPAPYEENGYSVDWPDLRAPSDKDKADIGEKRTKTMAEYLKGGVDSLVPPKAYLVREMGYSEEEIEAFMEEIEEAISEEDAEAREVEGEDQMIDEDRMVEEVEVEGEAV